MEVFELEHNNLRAALAFFEQHDPISMLDLAARCAWFWHVRGHWQEGRRWHEAAIARVTQPVERTLWARALLCFGLLAYRCGDIDVAEESLREVLEIRRADNDLAGMPSVLINLANIASDRGDLAEARTLYSEALAAARETDDRWHAAAALNNLGEVAFDEEDYSTAESLLLEALELVKEIGNGFLQSHVESLLGRIALGQGDLAGAAGRYRSSIQLARELDYPERLMDSLGELMLLAVQLDDPEAGAYLLGARDGVRVRRGLEGTEPGAQPADAETAIRDALDADTYAERFAAGAEADEDEALAFALARIIEPAEASASR